MSAMRGARAVTVLVMCVLLMSSCSWVKRIRGFAPRHFPASTEIQPAPEQQKAAMEMLQRMNAGTSGDALAAEQGGEEQTSQSSSGREVEGSSREIEQPRDVIPGVDSRGMSGQTTYTSDPEIGEYGGDERSSAPRADDPAVQHGLRSPSLPKMLPMDMDGKLNPGI